MNIPFLEALAKGGMVADGAMGSLLYERGVFVNRNFDEVNLSQSELVYRIHRDYLLAGANLIETNTYGANRVRLARHGLAHQTQAINQAAVQLVRRAVEHSAYVGGSIGPTGLSAGEVRRCEKDIHTAYQEQALLLTQEGCDVLVLETFQQPAELQLAVEAARSVSSLPIVAHITVANDGSIADGTSPADLAREMHMWGANAVGVNCNAPTVLYEAACRMLEAGLPVSVMPNAGMPQHIEDRLIYLATPENFGVFARRLYKAGVSLVGGCCGTSPAHIARVAAAARMVVPQQKPMHAVVSDVPQEAKPPIPLQQRSAFGAKLGNSFVVSVEVNPHTGLSTHAPVEAARRLLACGADVINIADGPRATVRMSNLALALHMQQQLSCEVLLHMCCRDHNLLGLQSLALGAHVLGIRNLVVVTGDPPKIGDYPDATAVYDLDSIGLLKMLQGYNQGIDPAGAPMDQTSFVLATGAEPAAADFEREILRLRQKVQAGANLVMTQPVYDPTHLNRFLNAIEDLQVPVLVGVLPLASYRNAEFLHNHIPGMAVPENIRNRMKKAGKGEAARQEGVAIALEALKAVKNRVQGAYIMPPLGRYEMAEAIIAAL